MAAAYFLICAMLWMLYAWLPDTIHSRFGLSLAGSGLNATLFLQISSAAGVLGGGALGDWAAARSASGRFYLVAAGLLVGMIGYSRIYLGVHWPTDVIAGYAAAAVWVGGLVSLDRWRRHFRARAGSSLPPRTRAAGRTQSRPCSSNRHRARDACLAPDRRRRGKGAA